MWFLGWNLVLVCPETVASPLPFKQILNVSALVVAPLRGLSRVPSALLFPARDGAVAV